MNSEGGLRRSASCFSRTRSGEQEAEDRGAAASVVLVSVVTICFLRNWHFS